VCTFGCNDHCALGREASDDDGDGRSFCPGFVDLGCATVIAQVSAGDSHTAVLTRQGQVFIWGAFRVRAFVCRTDFTDTRTALRLFSLFQFFSSFQISFSLPF